MKKAYTLLELSIVIFIVGLVLIGSGSGVQWISKITQSIKTDALLQAQKESIIGFALNNKTLPINAQRISLGVENKDSFGKTFTYIYDTNLETYGSICNKKTTTFSLVICEDSGCSIKKQVLNNIAFFVLSSGYNQNLQTNILDTSSWGEASKIAYGIEPQTNSVLQIYNNMINIDDYPNDINDDTMDYDDLISWMSLDELRAKTFCNSQRLSILNNELPYGYEANPYIVSIFPSAGVPFEGNLYKWSYTISPVLTCSDNLDINFQASILQITCDIPIENVYKVTISVSDSETNSFTKDFALTINN